jgi:hypothetical protein
VNISLFSISISISLLYSVNSANYIVIVNIVYIIYLIGNKYLDNDIYISSM